MGPRNLFTILALGSILIIGTFLRFQDICERGMGHVESYTPGIDFPADLSIPPPRLTLWKTITGSAWEPHPPGWYVAMWFWTSFFGSDLLILRLPSALLGIGSIFLMYVLGILEEDRRIALLGAGLLAVNGPHILWSQMARPYSMTCFLGLLSTIFLVLVLRGGNWHRAYLCSYLVFTLFSLYSLYYFWPIFATQILWILLISWQRRALFLGVLKAQLLILILASPITTLALFQARKSYLESDILSNLINYLQFGYLFAPDPFHVTEYFPPAGILLASPVVASLVFLIGLIAEKTRTNQITDPETVGPAPVHLAIAAVLAVVVILSGIKFIHDAVPHKFTKSLVASSALPIFILLTAFLLIRSAGSLQRMFQLSRQRRMLPGKAYSLAYLLAIIPPLIIAGVSLLTPFFAARGMLLYTPYLLVVLSVGLVSVCRIRRRWLSTVAFVFLSVFLVVTHYSSFQYQKHRPIPSIDYKGLAEKWAPHLKQSDLILVRRHYATGPIFYYVKRHRYHFVGEKYAQHINSSAYPRVWVLSFPTVPPTKEMKEPLGGYQLTQTLTARFIKVELYTSKKTWIEPLSATKARNGHTTRSK